ncbi:MAG: LysR family transcriptional regulator [Pseudomonadota bacterium]
MNWDDHRYFLAIARAKSLTGAARALGVSQPTVSRRLAALEARQGVRLFDRKQPGYELSVPGREAFEALGPIERDLAALDRRLRGQDQSLRGSLRLTCTEVLFNDYLGPRLAPFLEAHPGLDLSVFCTFERLSLSRREADVALRFTGAPAKTLVGRRLAKAAFAVYASPHLVPETPFESHPEVIEALPWIGWQDEGYNRLLIHKPFSGAVIKHRVDSMQSLVAMAKWGLGVTVLPCYIADPDPGLVRLAPEPLPSETPDLWLLYHPDVKGLARLRLLTDFLCEHFAKDQGLFEGRSV